MYFLSKWLRRSPPSRDGRLPFTLRNFTCMSKILLKTKDDIIVHAQQEESKNPCWIAYMHPYVFVVPDDEKPWKLEIEEINNGSYNYSKLLRVVSKIKYDGSGFDGLVCYDGTLALPMRGRFLKKENAIEYFNEVFLKFNLNGFFVGYVDHKDVLYGRLEGKWGVFTYQMGKSATAQLHSKNRLGIGSDSDSVNLDIPRILKVSQFHEILLKGSDALNKVPNLSPKFLNFGIAELRYQNWDSVLSNLWITAEQLIDHLWHKTFLENQMYHPQQNIQGRRTSMKEDNRTWSAGVKQEMLFQSKIISEEMLSNLFEARRNRNKLVHEGKAVGKDVAWKLFDAVSSLLEVSIGGHHHLADGLTLDDRNIMSEFFDPMNESFEDWKSVPDEHIIEAALGAEVTKNAKLPNT